jgi:hypothetical protein
VPFFVKILVILVLLFIVFSLFSGMFFMIKDKGSSDRMVKALTVRISLSLVLFVLLMVGFGTGIFHR